MTHVRSFNSEFSFASLGAKVKAQRGYGPYCFRVHGQIYHRSLTLHPASCDTRKYVQFYILDLDKATDQRLKIPEIPVVANPL